MYKISKNYKIIDNYKNEFNSKGKRLFSDDILNTAKDIISKLYFQPNIYYVDNIILSYDINKNRCLEFELFEDGRVNMSLFNYKTDTYFIDPTFVHIDEINDIVNDFHFCVNKVRYNRVFISQPMAGLSKEEIMKIRKETINYLYKKNNGPCEIIGWVDESAPNVNHSSVWYLAKSIELLSTVDAAYFCDGWQAARGCCIEHEVCDLYKIPIIE